MSDQKPPRQKPVKIDVKIDDAVSVGQYTNMMRIFHNQGEFIMDAMFLAPQSKSATVLSRLVLSPIHAKFLHRALTQNINMYEKKFGEIQLKPASPQDPGPILH